MSRDVATLDHAALEHLVTSLADGTAGETLLALKADLAARLPAGGDEAAGLASGYLDTLAKALAEGVPEDQALSAANEALGRDLDARDAAIADHPTNPLIAALSMGNGADKALSDQGGTPAARAAFAAELGSRLSGDADLEPGPGTDPVSDALSRAHDAGQSSDAAAASQAVALQPGAALAASLARGGEETEAALQGLVKGLPPDQAAALLEAFQAALAGGTDPEGALAQAQDAAGLQAAQADAATHGVTADIVAAILARGGDVAAALAAAGLDPASSGSDAAAHADAAAALQAALASGSGTAAATQAAAGAESAAAAQTAAAAAPSAQAALMQALASGDKVQQAVAAAGPGDLFASSLAQALAAGAGAGDAVMQAAGTAGAAAGHDAAASVTTGPAGLLLASLATGAGVPTDAGLVDALNAALSSGQSVQLAAAAADVAMRAAADQAASSFVPVPGSGEPTNPATPASPAAGPVAISAAAPGPSIPGPSIPGPSPPGPSTDPQAAPMQIAANPAVAAAHEAAQSGSSGLDSYLQHAAALNAGSDGALSAPLAILAAAPATVVSPTPAVLFVSAPAASARTVVEPAATLHANTRPETAGIAAQTATQDRAFSFSLPAGSFTDADLPDGDRLTLTAVRQDGSALPSWLVFDAATGSFQGVPANADVGAVPIRVTATDLSGLSVNASFVLTVANVNDAPVAAIQPTAQFASQGQPFAYTLAPGSFTDIDAPYGDHLTVAATRADGSSLPAWLAFDPVTETFHGTPATGDGGLLQILVTATDSGGLSASAGFALTVAATAVTAAEPTPVTTSIAVITPVAVHIDAAPVAGAALSAQTALQNAAFSYTLPAGSFTDPDAGDHLTLSATRANGTALPSWLAFDAATGTFHGTPANGDVGSLALTVTATDMAGSSASSSFALTVANVNDAPVAAILPTAQSVLQGHAFSYTLAPGSFTDPDTPYGDHLTLSATRQDGSALPTWLSFNAATGTFSGTPGSGDVGTVQVAVTATDSGGLSASSGFALGVHAPVGNAPTNISLSPDATDTIGYSISAGHSLVGGLGGAAGYGEITLAKADDSYTSVDVSGVFADGFHLGTTTYSASTGFYVGTNGYVTFGTGLSSYSSTGISAVNVPMVAIQYADLDTTKGGNIYVDVDSASETVTVTYLGVRAYNSGITSTNSYQIRLHDLGSGDFAIELRYDTLNWAGSSGYATAGWTAGQVGSGNYGEVQGSGTAQFTQNTSTSNVDQPGVYAWEVRDGSVGNSVSVYEHSVNGTVVGSLATTDRDTGDSFTYSLLNDAGGLFGLQTTNGKTQLIVANGAGLDHATAPSEQITVQTVDSTGNSFAQNLTILVAQQPAPVTHSVSVHSFVMHNSTNSGTSSSGLSNGSTYQAMALAGSTDSGSTSTAGSSSLTTSTDHDTSSSGASLHTTDAVHQTVDVIHA